MERHHEHSIPCLCSQDQQHFGEELDRATRYVEELATRMQILNEEVRNTHAERLNSLAYVFSVVATVFLLLRFLTGLLGVNVGGIPGVEHPYAFWIFTALCVVRRTYCRSDVRLYATQVDRNRQASNNDRRHYKNVHPG